MHSNIFVRVFGVFGLAGIVVLFAPGYALAGEYFLIEREQYQLCHDLVENFNRFKDEPPMVCERKFHPDFKDFTLPKWEELDAKHYIGTLERLLVNEKRTKKKELSPAFKKKVQEGSVRLWRSRIDINFDGQQNVVYMMNVFACDPINDFDSNFAPLMTFMAERNDPDPTNFAFEFFNGSRYGGVFFYKGRPYLHSWKQWANFNTERSKKNEPSPRIVVYETHSAMRHYYESFGKRPVCEIGYRE